MKGRMHKGTPKRASGGKIAFDAGNKDVVKEAKSKTTGVMDGEKGKERMDRPKRASGGRAGSPLSSASKVSQPGSPTAEMRSGGGKC